MNIGGLYSYPRTTKDIRSTEDVNSFGTGKILQAGELFVVLAESKAVIGNRVHLKILTTQGFIGWIAYVDKNGLKEVNP